MRYNGTSLLHEYSATVRSQPMMVGLYQNTNPTYIDAAERGRREMREIDSDRSSELSRVRKCSEF